MANEPVDKFGCTSISPITMPKGLNNVENDDRRDEDGEVRNDLVLAHFDLTLTPILTRNICFFWSLRYHYVVLNNTV